MNVNSKGSFAESLALHLFFKSGFSVYKPFHDYSPIDLIVSKDHKRLLRIQVKYKCIENGLFSIPTESVVNGKRVANDLSIIDAWACYIPDFDKMIFIGKKEREDNISMRFVEPIKQNTRCLKVLNIEDYTDPNRLLEG